MTDEAIEEIRQHAERRRQEHEAEELQLAIPTFLKERAQIAHTKRRTALDNGNFLESAQFVAAEQLLLSLALLALSEGWIKTK